MIGAMPDVVTKGGYVQAAVMLNSAIERVRSSSWIPPMELAVRYQDVDNGGELANIDLGLVVADTGRIQVAEVGMNFYIRDHNLKVQTNYSYVNLEGGRTSNLSQLQLQLDF